jgi:hypothetical protein
MLICRSCDVKEIQWVGRKLTSICFSHINDNFVVMTFSPFPYLQQQQKFAESGSANFGLRIFSETCFHSPIFSLGFLVYVTQCCITRLPASPIYVPIHSFQHNIEVLDLHLRGSYFESRQGKLKSPWKGSAVFSLSSVEWRIVQEISHNGVLQKSYIIIIQNPNHRYLLQ